MVFKSSAQRKGFFSKIKSNFDTYREKRRAEHLENIRKLNIKLADEIKKERELHSAEESYEKERSELAEIKRKRFEVSRLGRFEKYIHSPEFKKEVTGIKKQIKRAGRYL